MNKKTLIIINILLLVILVCISVKENYLPKFYNFIKSKTPVKEVEIKTQNYKHETALYKEYNKKGNIVMLGNSITYRVHWNELLNRNDIINRGIGNDITKGMLMRLQDVYKANPKICFVMGGINDINKGVKKDEIVSNLHQISSQLKSKNITPIIYSIIYVAESYPNFIEINQKIHSVNKNLIAMCIKNDIKFVNLNEVLATNKTLNETYSFDGLHLTASAYKKWKEIITPIIIKALDEETELINNKSAN